jgi:type IV pilus assembly protein PilO
MSSAVVVPPPNSSSLQRFVPRLTARARVLLTAVNLHYAGVAALCVVVLYLIVHLVVVQQSLTAHNDDAIAGQRAQLRAAEIAAKPLDGLDVKLADSTADANKFYLRRLPYASSQVAAELGALAKKQGVRWTRAQYTYNPVLSGEGALTEVHIDANVSGDYRPMVQFINTAERDKLFFVINGINFTGQQNGQVNLRIRLTTYLRALGPDESMPDLASASDGASAATAGGAR